MGKLSLTLFFTRGGSLQLWEQVGMFEREVALYQQLQNHNIRVTFVTYGTAADLSYARQLPGIKILCNRWGLPSLTYQRLLPLLHAPWLVKSHIIKTNQTNGAHLALRAARLWRKPLVARCGYMWSEFVARRYGTGSSDTVAARRMEQRVFTAAARIVVTTPRLAQDIKQRLPAIASRVEVIPNYVDTHLFCPAAEVEHEVDLIFIGRLAPQKNITALLGAIQPLRVTLWVIGSGALAKALQQRFGTLDGRLQWLGNVPNNYLPRYLNRTKVFVLPSLYEGHPKTLLEAMACGLPVLGADSPGIRDVIEHNQTGWLCHTDSGSIRQAVQTLLAQPRLRAKLGQNARLAVEQQFSLNRVLTQELQLLQSLHP